MSDHLLLHDMVADGSSILETTHILEAAIAFKQIFAYNRFRRRQRPLPYHFDLPIELDYAETLLAVQPYHMLTV